jgi:hypothetical protein
VPRRRPAYYAKRQLRTSSSAAWSPQHPANQRLRRSSVTSSLQVVDSIDVTWLAPQPGFEPAFAGATVGRPGTLRLTAGHSRELHADVLDLRIAGERLEAFFATVPALLVAAERQLDAAAGAVRVDVDLAGLDAR